jgi:GNAT superfamily N-acetyltransferase
LTQIAFAAKRHWDYDDHLIELWADELTVSADFVSTHPCYCAVRDAEILGFYALSGSGEEHELEHMWVDPEFVRSGVGAMLLAHAAQTVAARGGSVLTIASDPNAEGFYRRMGAVPIGSVPSRPEGRTLPLLRLVIESKRATPT